MKNIIVVLLAVFVLNARATELVRSVTLTDGGVLYASDLHNLIDGATIGADFYNDQSSIGVLNSAYYFLLLDANSGSYHRITAQNLLYGNTNIWLNQIAGTNVNSHAFLLFYDSTNNIIRRISASDLFNSSQQFINTSNQVVGFRFATTNGQSLPVLSGSFTGLTTNNPLNLLTWGTNGVPYYVPLAVAETNMAADFGTNLMLSYTFNQMFQPWMVYGTNTFTNAWGFQTNFPISNLYLTNSYPTSTNTPTLVDSDTIPVDSTQQGTNTSASLFSLYQYLAAKNTLPAYTQARVQFSGNVVTVATSNAADNVNGLIRVATNSFYSGTIYPVCFNTNSISTAIITNQLYFVTAQATNNTWLHVYSNYPTANSGTNWIAVASTSVGGSQIYYLTNYTSYNCDVIPQISAPSTTRAGIYSVIFRTNSATPYYYVSATAGNTEAGNTYLNLDTQRPISTSGFTLMSKGTDNLFYNIPMAHVLVNPQ